MLKSLIIALSVLAAGCASNSTEEQSSPVGQLNEVPLPIRRQLRQCRLAEEGGSLEIHPQHLLPVRLAEVAQAHRDHFAGRYEAAASAGSPWVMRN